MGLFSRLGRQLLKVIEWKDPSNSIMVYRYPMDDRTEIMNGSQLIVQESQQAILVKDGMIGDVFGPGRHKLETANLPLLTTIASWKYGFDSPFKADIYYINTKQFINLKWGTTNPVMMRDADFGAIRIRAFGKYGLKINEPVAFMREIFGSNQEYDTASLTEYFKTVIVSKFSDAVGEAKIAALDIASHYNELADVLKEVTKPDFENIGIELTNMYVENVSLPESVEQAIDKRSSVGIFDGKMNDFMKYQTAEAIRDAANNEGNGLAGAGVGLGAGVGMANAFRDAFSNNQPQPQQQPQQAQPQQQATDRCSSCNAIIAKNAKFCPECGQKQNDAVFCTECGTKLNPGAKFCPECGTKA